MKRINTHWEVWSYDVWGNKKDRYDVSDQYKYHVDYEISCKVKIANPGTIKAFEHCTPSDYAIRQALSIKKWIKIETDGDDVTIYVNASKDGYPIGELRCISHESLSPIKAR